jgi:hypothetical protein
MSADAFEARLAHLEGAFGQLDHRLESLERMMIARFDQIDLRFNQIDSRFNQIDSRFGQQESRFNQMESRFSIIDQRFNWLIGILFTSWISTILTVLFHR